MNEMARLWSLIAGNPDPDVVDWMPGIDQTATKSDAYTRNQESNWLNGLPDARLRAKMDKEGRSYNFPIIDYGYGDNPAFTTKDMPPEHRQFLQEYTGRRLPRSVDYEATMERDAPKTRLPHEPVFDELNSLHEALLRTFGRFSGNANRHPTKAYRERMGLGILRDDPLTAGAFRDLQGQRHSVPGWIIDQFSGMFNSNPRSPAQTPAPGGHWENYGRGERNPNTVTPTRKLHRNPI